MRTVCALLATLASLASVSALAPFDKANCASAAISRSLSPAISNDGAWNCFTFSVAQTDNQLATLDLPAGSEGAVLQMYAWNSDQTGGDLSNSDYRWYNANNGRGWLSLARPQNSPIDLNNLATAWTTASEDRYQAVESGVSLDTLAGWTSGLRSAGVYAFTAKETLNPGRNILILKHPSQGSGTTVSAFTGSFLWRVIYPTSAGINQVITPGTGADYTGAFSALSLNRAVQVNNLLSPGTGLSLQVDEQFANVGWAMRGFQYTAAVTQSGLVAGNLSANAWMANTPMVLGWSGTSGVLSANNSRDAADSQTLWGNYTDNNPAVFGPAAGNITHDTSIAETDVVTRTWDTPLDFASVTDWGLLSFTVPSFMQWGADWTGQVSPFLDVTLTVTWVNDYPLLSSLSGATFRNYDENTVMGHTVQDTNNQVPSRIYRVSTNSMWWRARVSFSNVENLNKPSGVTDAQPGCDPLWEVQRVTDWNSRTYTNGFSGTWSSSGTVGSFSFDDFEPSTTNAAANSQRWMLNDFWSSVSYGSLLATTAPTRNVWMLVRVSAAKDVDSNGAKKACGSNWIRVGSASFSTSGVTDQCSAPADCLVDAANNPNKDQADVTANAGINAAARFSSCAVIASVGPEGRRVPTTKCVECLDDNQCEDGQYCHVDNGICSAANPANYYYNCDADSGKLYGVCIAKSTEVLGRRCRSAFQGPAGSGTSASTMTQVGATSFRFTSATSPPFGGPSMPFNFATKGDAANGDFAVGGLGACGEWKFWNGTSRFDSAANWISSNNQVRYALWTGVCHRGRCLECYPGGMNPTGGKVCLNGRTFAAMDVDGTVRTFAEDTGAGTELGTTSMVILLLVVFWMYMYAEAKRWRAANGKPAMTCCECLCCCDACTKFDAAGAATTNPAAK